MSVQSMYDSAEAAAEQICTTTGQQARDTTLPDFLALPLRLLKLWQLSQPISDLTKQAGAETKRCIIPPALPHKLISFLTG